ncbi:MAG: hypothetical protein K6T78_09855 [Alicyclobacillus sp.]|nr:hypothetical protein [Alicyclobacillus sp.]
MDVEGQQLFLKYILERVQEGKEEEARALLAGYFQKQADGTFTPEEIAQSIPRILSLLRPEKIVEVQAVMKRFAESHGVK